MNHRFLKAAVIAAAISVAASGAARADCEADLVTLENALNTPNLSASASGKLEQAGKEASSALRKDDDDSCHLIITQALANAGLAATAPAGTSAAPLGDLTTFKAITTDTLTIVEGGDLGAAKKRIKDLETAWDNARPALQPANPQSWETVDKAIDSALKALRASSPEQAACKDKLVALIQVIDSTK